jgi:hypothetical protein
LRSSRTSQQTKTFAEGSLYFSLAGEERPASVLFRQFTSIAGANS